jgi:Zn-dependent metalloprotease
MNEAFSDIWGACVEYYAAPSKSTWLIGEDIMKNGCCFKVYERSKAQGQPDTYWNKLANYRL